MMKCFNRYIKIEQKLDDVSNSTVDRKFICAVLARYLNDKDEDDQDLKYVTVSLPEGQDVEMLEFISHYGTRVLCLKTTRKKEFLYAM